MRRLSLMILYTTLSMLIVEASAQQITKKRIGVYNEAGSVVVAEANTTLVVDIVVEKEEFKAGPYARYAQKLLGKRASFVDKSEYRIVHSEVALFDDNVEDDTKHGDACVKEYNLPLQIDRVSSVEATPEDAAYDAAELIFKLRRSRLELITGELGEGVYGGGLESALREIDRLEQSYLELFYGKCSVSSYERRVVLPIEPGITNYVVARFSSDEGLIESDNLAGDIVMVTIKPTACDYPQSDEKGTVAFRYANNSEVVLSVGGDKLAQSVIPIYEFGATVMYLMPR